MFRPSRRVEIKRTILTIQLSITDTFYICSPAPDGRSWSSGMFRPSRRVDNNLIMSESFRFCHSDDVAVGGFAALRIRTLRLPVGAKRRGNLM